MAEMPVGNRWILILADAADADVQLIRRSFSTKAGMVGLNREEAN